MPILNGYQTPNPREDKALVGHYEPVYPNLFDVSISFPQAVDSTKKELLLANVLSVEGLEIDKTPEKVMQKFKGATRTYAGSLLDDTSHEVTLSFEVNLDDSNQMYVYKMLQEWLRLIYNPETGERGLASEYATGIMTIVIYNKKHEVFKTYKCKNIFISSPLPPIDLAYDNGEPWKLEGIIFTCDIIDTIDN